MKWCAPKSVRVINFSGNALCLNRNPILLATKVLNQNLIIDTFEILSNFSISEMTFHRHLKFWYTLTMICHGELNRRKLRSVGRKPATEIAQPVLVVCSSKFQWIFSKKHRKNWWKSFSTNVVFWPILAEISTNLLFWGHQNSQNFSHLRPNFGRIPIKSRLFSPRGLMNPFDSQKILGVLPALFGTAACISDNVLKKHQK